MFLKKESQGLDSNAQASRQFQQDFRKNKLNLCLGYFMDEERQHFGFTVLDDVDIKIEGSLALNMLGSGAFREQVLNLLLKDNSRLFGSSVQTLGATGALSLIFSLLKQSTGAADVWLSRPTWGNHHDIATQSGLAIREYDYKINASGDLDIDQMLESLSRLSENNVLVLQGCCHNPTGIDLDESALRRVAEFIRQRKAILVVDFAYFGLGEGVNQDRDIIRILADSLDDFFIALSFSKNLGLYAERLGALTYVTKHVQELKPFDAQISKIIRARYSMPPLLQASKVAHVFSDSAYSDRWQQELTLVRTTLRTRKEQLLNRLDALGLSSLVVNPKSRGMFLSLNLSKTQIERLADSHATYILPSGRLSLASLRLQEIERLVNDLVAVVE